VPGSTLTETLNDGQSLSEFSSIPTKQTNDGYLYLEDNIKIKKFEANVGVNLSACLVDSSIYPTIQPRIRLLWNLDERFSIHGSYTEMTQNIHMLTRNAMDLSTDLWLPSTSRIKPMYAKQAVFGCEYHFAKRITASFEAYYKTMENLIEYKEGANYIENQSDWESLITSGSGVAYGAEFLLEKKSGQFTGWVSYTLSWATRQFEELNNGSEFPFKYDRRNNFSIVGIWNFNEKVNLSATWVYYTGTAYTLTEGLYPTFYPDGSSYGYWAQAFSDRNAYRMPDYHRLDINANFTKQKKRGTRVWSVGIYNLYNRQNPYFMYLDFNDNGTAILKQVCFFPIMPSFSYSFSF
ncbi:MAG: TonB-dependent receptor, partial [Bacteroidales bacterium]|nr:TonB-dependent receptor [Bacteroidales bacterium]